MPTQNKSSSTRQSRTSARTGSSTARSGSTTNRSSSSGGRATSSGSSRTASRSRASTRSESRSTRSQDAIALLTQDHRKVQKAFRDAEKLEREDEELQEIVQTTCEDLTLHAQIEEELVYPAIMEALKEDDQDLIHEAEVEHASAKQLIAQLEQMSPDDETYQATFKVLGEYVNHHIQEEEREMFPKAKRAKVDLESLGQAILAQKEAAGKGEETAEE
jgi:hemerythrin superfamily protein